MGEKKNDAGEKKKKKDDDPITVVLKIDMHCEGCAAKIVKTVRGFDGVDAAKTDFGANKLSVIGNLDPAKLREKLAEKMKKKVDLISPQPSKKDGDDNKKNKPEGNDKKNKPDEKKPKEKQIPVSTAVFKLRLHCEGCISKIRKTVTKTKGFNDMSLDKQKDTMTVAGSIDMKALAEALAEKLKRPVEIVPPKKEKDAGEKDGAKGDNASGGKKKGGGGNKVEESKMEESRMEYVGLPVPGFGYGPGPGIDHGLGYGPGPGFGYGYGYGPMPGYGAHQAHAPQMFSDENPNACSVM